METSFGAYVMISAPTEEEPPALARAVVQLAPKIPTIISVENTVK
tara:strand:+ start:351 stop:485 length:135 start_codon:yes stop_codon:yes gene_type:complete